MRVPLGVLDQSPVISGHSPAEAIAETISLARLAEELGYRRYWLAEHHGIAALADPCPARRLRHLAHARRNGRRPPALLQRAQDRRAVPHAGGALSRADRSGHRARAGR